MKLLAVIFIFVVTNQSGAFFMNLNHVSKDKKPHHMHSTRPLEEEDSPKFKRHADNVEDVELSSQFWRIEAQKKLRSQLKKEINTNIAKNVIFFLGDGMSLATITASRIYAGQKMKKSGEENVLSFEEFPFTGLSKTYCVDKQTADSACSATAYLTGVKGNYATIGVNGKVKLNDCKSSLDKENHVSSIMKWAQDAGKATGIVTTTRITHASPAGTYAHTANRDWESDADIAQDPNAKDCYGHDIAMQLIHSDPGKNFNVIYGGGRVKFLSEKIIDEGGERGERLDGRDLVDEWLEQKKSPTAHYIHDRDGLRTMNHSNIENVLGLFASSHLEYHLNAQKTNQPTLEELTISAIEVMKKNEKGFVLFVEGGRIDHSHHENRAIYALDETVEFAKAIQKAVDVTDEKDTLIVVTSDHSHVMTLSGYAKRGKDILGLNSEISDMDSMPYLTLSYANGPSGVKKRKMMSEEEIDTFDYQYPSLVPLKYETHGGDDVAIYSRGPFSHLFTGSVEQNTIPHFIGYASCIGDTESLTACNQRR